ncbi:hypothetical protein ANDA3_2734 [plant metagenome]|uniref:Uncharacterized protein n=1 Tax=plant metagenome TaxID=1297885 RepID=A0A484R216_9ZZZZ
MLSRNATRTGESPSSKWLPNWRRWWRRAKPALEKGATRSG